MRAISQFAKKLQQAHGCSLCFNNECNDERIATQQITADYSQAGIISPTQNLQQLIT